VTGSSRTHIGTESVPLSESEVVGGDVPFNRSNDWSLDGRRLLLERYLNGVRLRNASDSRIFDPGDRLVAHEDDGVGERASTRSVSGSFTSLRDGRRGIAEGTVDAE
jgi:hypothetical protein